MPRYRVIAPVVIAKTMGDHGWQYVHLQQGAPVPDDAEEVWIQCHLRDRMISEIAVDAPPAAAPLPVGDAGPMTAQPSTPPDPPPVTTPPVEESKPLTTGRSTRSSQRGGS